MRPRILLALGCAQLAFAVLAPSLAFADGATLKEIVVTAQKRPQLLINVPMSISVLSGDSVHEQDIRTAQDLSFAVPGMTTREDGPGSYTIFMRGMSNQYGTGAVVAVYLDNVPITLTGVDQLDFRPMDIKRIEVLKGPQGTLYGEGSMAGTIRYITNDPDLAEFHAKVRATLATIDGGSGKQAATAMVNLPLVDNKLAVRLVGHIAHGGGWQDQPQAGIFNGNYQDLKVFRGEALWRPISALSVKATVLVHRNESKLGLGYENADRTIFVAINPATQLIPKTINYVLSNLDVTYDFSKVQVLSSTSYINLNHHYPFAYIGGPETIYQGDIQGNDARHVAAKQFSQELRLTSRESGPWKWTVGSFYKNLRDNLFAAYDSLYAGTLYSNLTYTENDTYNSLSLYGDSSYALTPRLSIGAGIRYFKDDQSAFDGTTKQWARFHSTDPRVYASYKLSSDMSVYGSVSKGFRSGGFNVAPLPSYGPESVISYELGTKGLVAGNTVRYEFATYYSDYRDMLRRGLVFLPSFKAIESLTSNVGTAHIEGVEGGVTWRATAKLTLNATGSWIRSEIVSVAAAQATNIAGDPVDYVPKFSGTLGAVYRVNWAPRLPGYIRVDYDYRDKVDYVDRTSFPAEYLPQTSDTLNLLNARVGMVWHRADIDLFGTNLTNENKWVDPYHAWKNANRTRPRMVGIQVSYDFN